jgi:hypothetical protein
MRRHAELLELDSAPRRIGTFNPVTAALVLMMTVAMMAVSAALRVLARLQVAHWVFFRLRFAHITFLSLLFGLCNPPKSYASTNSC